MPASDPFEPFAIAAVELAAEKIVVLGQVVAWVSVDLRIGMEVELVIDTLFTTTSEDGSSEDQLVWRWSSVETATAEAEVAA